MTSDPLERIAQDVQQHHAGKKRCIGVCAGAGCMSSGSQGVLDSLKKSLAGQESVEVQPVGCLGACNQGPLVSVSPEGVICQKLTVEEAPAFATEVVEGRVAPHRRLFADRGGDTLAHTASFFNKQVKIVLEQCGHVHPESLDEAIAAGSYLGLKKALLQTRDELIAQIKNSGLRGRGGAGYPTGLKWEMVALAKDEVKYVICNGDEGDPGAFMDRSVLEGDPHRVLEGMIIAGYTIGAHQGYAYIRAEYPLAIRRMELAIKQARRIGLLGANVLETGYAFDVDIRVGAGAFVCGEETALMASIEGRRGQPRPRPPYPAQSGLWGHPTLINNVETFANIPAILRKGADWFRSLGTAKSPGTKVFALAGKIVNTGLIEVPMGITLREIIFEIGGGIPGGRKFKAVQTGGPSGGCIPEAYLDTPVDYESLGSLGSIMGSGGFIVMDDSSCMVDVARFFMEFCMDESCGRCVPCRVGTVQMHGLLEKICKGEGEPRDLALLEELAPLVRETSLCGLGMTAPNPLLSTLRYFRHEYESHLRDRTCPAGVCKMGVPA